MIKKIFGSKVEIIIEEIKTFLKMVWIKYRNHSHNHRKKFGAKKSQCSISRLKSIDFFFKKVKDAFLFNIHLLHQQQQQAFFPEQVG